MSAMPIIKCIHWPFSPKKALTACLHRKPNYKHIIDGWQRPSRPTELNALPSILLSLIMDMKKTTSLYFKLGFIIKSSGRMFDSLFHT